MTGLPIEERFADHKRGYKSAGVVARYGVELASEWYEGIPPMPYEEAALTEPELADEPGLRSDSTQATAASRGRRHRRSP